MLQALNEVKTGNAPGPPEVSLKQIAARGCRNISYGCHRVLD